MNITKIVFWNCQGVARRRPELLQFVQEHSIDVLLLNETHLSNNRGFKLPNFISYYTNTPRNGIHSPSAGTAILINRRLIHHRKIIPTTSITNTTVHINLGNSELRLVAVYKSPNTTLLTADLDTLLNTTTDTIIAGDLNSKHGSWNSLVSNSSGRILNNYLDNRQDTTVAAPTSPTHYPDNPNHRPDILDIALLKTGHLNFHLENFPEALSSDHSPIILNLRNRASQLSPPKPLHITDWNKFEEQINEASLQPPNTSSPRNIDREINSLTDVISTTLAACTTKLNSNNQTSSLPTYILREIAWKRRLRSLWQRSRDPAIKTQLNAQTTKVRRLLQTKRDNEWQNLLGSIAENSQGRSTFFNINRRLLRKPPPLHPLKDANGTLHYEPETKAEIFASSMENQFKSPTYYHPSDDFIHETLFNHNRSSLHQKSIFFTPEEVRLTIRNLKSKSAPGLDCISNQALKHCNKNVLLHLCRILNGCTRLEYFPDCWKNAAVIMIPKPGKNPLLPESYRPISLLNTLSKVYERLLLTRLNIQLAPKIRPEQFGFRSRHSTTLQLVNVLDDIVISKNRGMKTAAVLLDIQKAFDKVWHPGLIFKMIALGLPTQLINILKSFLSNRTFKIKIENKLSNNKPIEAGVPQGSCLSPQLFALYINDLPLHPNSKVALFADDTLLYATANSNLKAVSKLQRQINKIEPWFAQWRISLNPSKTNAILFSNKSPINTPKPKILNTQINWSTSITYLGVKIDRNLNFGKHVRLATQKSKAAAYLLFPMLNQKSPLSIQTKVFIYKMYIRPILTYACSAWSSNLSPTSWASVEAVQAIILRRLTDLPYFVSNYSIRKSLNIPSIKEFSDSSTLKLKSNISSSHHPHISGIAKRTLSTRVPTRNRPINF